jgi:hypothetical protein
LEFLQADCRQLLDWQAFSREADRIDSLSRGQLAFLELPTATDSVEKVQNLLKGQTEFEARISAQEVGKNKPFFSKIIS